MSDNIKVVVKVRPLIPREIEDKLFYQWRVENNTLYQIDQNERDVGTSFTFDKVYDKDNKTCDVYKDIAKPIVEAATAGFNGTIFAYGQTSSGKTYTMTGTEESPGIIQLAVLDLFEMIKNIPNRDFLVRVSYVEIYNETLTDLLNIEKKIKIQDTLQGVKVDATERVTSSPEEILDVMKEGKANRQTAVTNMNEQSSRSHSIFQITIESREHIEHESDSGCVNVSQLNLVDLAGSERAGQTGATGLRFKEGTHINKSLSSLALVIKQLSDDPNKHVNYRDSKLTRILQNSLGGNAKTSIICAVTPAAAEETVSTLQFANRAKAIKNKPAVNAVATDATMIQKLTKQLSVLKTELENKKSLEKDNYTLQKQIVGLQRLILNGFAQRSATEILNPRRKLVQPRRITISTLHSLQPIQEDAVPTVPKFCTPSLKYNPLVVPGALDFQPIQGAVSLPTLPEEPPRLVTPPPAPRPPPAGEDEIIELDSDDDCTSEPQTCPTSPYHKCYESSKTPPCILRKTAKRAERNLKDLVELTGREKIFEPSVVELMEKLDGNATVIARLEDEINKLNILSKEKDFEMDKLKGKISKFEEEIKKAIIAKEDLETRCKDYNTKLTDAEVCYETLKKKAQSREAELLSLLEEQVPKKPPENIGKISTQSEDKSLNFQVNPKEIKNLNDDNEISQTLHSTTQIEAQLTIKDTKILKLEETISAYIQKIAVLENINKDYQPELNSSNEKIRCVDGELQQCKATVDALNKIIDTQKVNIQSLNADIESYKNLIQEFRTKEQKENIPNININDRDLENLIASEENLIENNENMKNLLLSLKSAIISKNEEISSLKEVLEKNHNSDIDENIKREITNRNDEITNLSEKIKNIQIELNNKNEELSFQSTEHKLLNEKLREVVEENQVLTLINKNHTINIEDLYCKMKCMENEILEKNNIIDSLEHSHEETQEHFAKAKSALCKVQSIMEILTGNIQNVPSVIDNFVLFYNTFCKDLTSLEYIATEIKLQKTQFMNLVQKCQTEYSTIEQQIDVIIETFNEDENKSENSHMCFGANNAELELSSGEHIESIKMQEQSNVNKSAYESLLQKLEKLITILKTKQLRSKEIIENKDTVIANLNACISKYKNDIEAKDKELLLAWQLKHEIQKRDEFLRNLLKKCAELSFKFHLEQSVSSELNKKEEEVYEQIICTFNKITDYVEMMKNKQENDNLDVVLMTAKEEIQNLTEINRKFMKDLSNMETANCNLSEELNKIHKENKILAEDLNNSSIMLEVLQEELKSKVNDMENIEAKARDWKVQFINLDFLIKEQMHALQLENIELQKRSSESLRFVDKHKNLCDTNTYIGSNGYNRSTSKTSSDLKSPQSLLTLCCNIISEHTKPDDKPKSISTSSIGSNTPKNETDALPEACRCDKLERQLKEVVDENIKHKSTIEHLKISNRNLTKEHTEVQDEVKSLLDITYELQKKVVNHRTNLSTLTATTYAENKSLSSQIKFLQHHHQRFYNVCQRDIPAFKKQLETLHSLLKNENVISNDCLKRYSLPSALDNTSVISNFKNESTLDGDILMLDTNVTLTTTGDTTLVNHDQTCFDVTQICTYCEVACQTIDSNTVTNTNLLYSQISPNEEYKYMTKLEELKKENDKLRDMVNTYNARKKYKSESNDSTCAIVNESNQDKLSEILLIQNLSNIESENHSILDKYNNLLLEAPSTNALAEKLTASETKYYANELEKLNSMLNVKNKQIADVKEENESLSTQVKNNLLKIELLTQKLSDMESEKDSILDKYNNLLLEPPSIDTLNRKSTPLEKEYSGELEKLKDILNVKNQEIAELQHENCRLSTQVQNNFHEIELLTQKLSNIESEKDNILDKYNNLTLEIPSTDALVKKLTILEKEYTNDLEKLKCMLTNKNKEMVVLQDENNSLSTQVIEAISEVDELKKEQDEFKAINSVLTEKCLHLEIEVETLKSKYTTAKSTLCTECESKDNLISSLQKKISSESHSRLNRSFSDSDRTSRYNTICTLQNELHAGKEDCNKLKEEVTTIKNHLDRSNLSLGPAMDLDDSMGEQNIFTYTKDFDSVDPKSTMPDITEEHPIDMYAVDRTDCFNYYVELTGASKTDIGHDIKIIDIMKMLYNYVLVKHGNEVENLVNKLRDFEDSKIQLESRLEAITKEHSYKTNELKDKEIELETIKSLFCHIKKHISDILNRVVDSDDRLTNFKEHILKPLDTQFGLSSTLAYETVLNGFIGNLDEKTKQCSKLENDIKNIEGELRIATNNLAQISSQLRDKEKEYNLLENQKQRVQEICSAVTMDIIRKEKELDKIITVGCGKLLHSNILEQNDVTILSPLAKNIESIFDLVIKQFSNNNVELLSVKECLRANENDLLIQKTLLDDLTQVYDKKVQENNTNLAIINKMNEEINQLRESLQLKEIEIKLSHDKINVEEENKSLKDKLKELLLVKENLEQELGNLKVINEKISKENDDYASQLEESRSTINGSKRETESLTAEIHILKESVKESVILIDNLKQEIKSLFEENTQLKYQLQEKINNCSQLEVNIKTHEKTSEVQSRMIKRLQKQKEVDDEKDKKIEELKQTCSELEKERDDLKQDVKVTKEELQHLTKEKHLLEVQISELLEANKPGLSPDEGAATADVSRLRRQSIHDSNRMFAGDGEDPDRMEAIAGCRTKVNDMLMEVDGVDSNRSTPLRLSKGRDSSQCKHDQSEREEGSSRAGSALGARRRRQSLHDLHRAALSLSPAPQDQPRKLLLDMEKSDGHLDDSEVSELRKQLSSCREELEELRERYRELDEECDTCAQYLRERDAQCVRLRREKLALEQQISDLKTQLPNSMNQSGGRISYSDAAVNTDEDWANLHSVVVDRMSYDAEVEKNKKLTKTIEELRFKKQDLKATITKMQKALDKRSQNDNRELEAVKSELRTSKQELEALKERYRELDEECETCAQYLREREEQCRRLKDAKTALEAKLKEYEEEPSNVSLTVRKRRQTLHDQNRQSATVELVDACTETAADFLSYQVERDTPRPDDSQLKELKRLRIMVDKLSQQKAVLEQQLVAASAHAPLFVATGSAIVQNQQLTDVMKENQKLKRINAKLIQVCKKRGKSLSENRENQDPSEHA